MTISEFRDKMFMTMNTNELGSWLIKERTNRKMSQAELARRAGITRGAISNYEANKVKSPDPEVLRAIAKALVVPEILVFQKAGLLSPKPKTNLEYEEAVHLLNQLTEDELSEITELMQFKIERRVRD